MQELSFLRSKEFFYYLNRIKKTEEIANVTAIRGEATRLLRVIAGNPGWSKEEIEERLKEINTSFPETNITCRKLPSFNNNNKAGNKNGRGHQPRANAAKSSNKTSASSAKDKCRHGGESGHWARDCPKKIKTNNKGNNSNIKDSETSETSA